MAGRPIRSGGFVWRTLRRCARGRGPARMLRDPGAAGRRGLGSRGQRGRGAGAPRTRSRPTACEYGTPFQQRFIYGRARVGSHTHTRTERGGCSAVRRCRCMHRRRSSGPGIGRVHDWRPDDTVANQQQAVGFRLSGSGFGDLPLPASSPPPVTLQSVSCPSCSPLATCSYALACLLLEPGCIGSCSEKFVFPARAFVGYR